MRSKVAEAVREEQRAEMLALPVEERLALMFELGERQLQTYMALHGLTRDEALRRIEHANQDGRRPSGVMRRIIDESRSRDTRDPR